MCGPKRVLGLCSLRRTSKLSPIVATESADWQCSPSPPSPPHQNPAKQVGALIRTRPTGGPYDSLSRSPDKDSRATGAWCKLIKSGFGIAALVASRSISGPRPFRSHIAAMVGAGGAGSSGSGFGFGLGSGPRHRHRPGSDSHILAASNQQPNYTKVHGAQWVRRLFLPLCR